MPGKSCLDSIIQSLHEAADHTEVSTWDIPDYSFVLDVNTGSSEVYRVLGLHNLSLQLWTTLRKDIEDPVACRPSDFFDMLHSAILSPDFIQLLVLSSPFYKTLASSELHKHLQDPEYCLDVTCISAGKLVEFTGAQAFEEWFDSDMRPFAIRAREAYDDHWHAICHELDFECILAKLPSAPKSCSARVGQSPSPLSSRIEPEQAYLRRMQLIRTSKCRPCSSQRTSPVRKLKSPFVLSRSSTQTKRRAQKENIPVASETSTPRRISHLEASSPLFRGAVQRIISPLLTPPTTPLGKRPHYAGLAHNAARTFL